MLELRLAAWSPVAAFTALAVVLAAVGGLPVDEAVWAAVAVALCFVPTGWLAPGGWTRRASESALLPVAFVFTMVGNPEMRQMLLPPLLVLAAWAVTAASLRICGALASQLVLVCFGLSIRAAAGLGLVGIGVVNSALAVAAAALLPLGAARWGGRRVGLLAALLAATLPQAWLPAAALVAVAVGVALMWIPPLHAPRRWRLAHWLPGVAGAALVACAVAPWGGLTLAEAFPAATWVAGAVFVAVLAVAPRLPPAVAGLAWFAAVALLGPVLAAPPDRGGFTLTAESPERRLPAAGSGTYVVDVALARGGGLANGTEVATLSVAGKDRSLRAGVGVVEWAAERSVKGPGPAHDLPDLTIRRPARDGDRGFWKVSGRTVLEVPAGETPVLRRSTDLPDEVKVVVPTAGPSTVTRPRDWPFATWLWATVAAVVLLQLLSGTWRHQSALLPWLLLTTGSYVIRLPVEPLRLVVERYGIDLCLVVLLGAWLPAARHWWKQGRIFPALAALLAVLALATPHLTPPLYGDEPFHLVALDSLAVDHDLDLGNNVDLEEHPYQELFIVDGSLFHSPVLAILLLPGYLVAGRSGALLLLALAGALTATLMVRRSAVLGLARSRQALLAAALALSYPLVTFSTQIWPEVLGALAVCVALIAATGQRMGWLTAAVVALVATSVKTRFALLTFPIAAAAWWRGGRRKLALLVISVTAVSSLLVGWLFMGHPFGYYRRLHHLLPNDVTQAFIVVGGLLFDAAGGVLFAAPLAVVAVLGLPLLWRRGGAGERALMVGGGLTIFALLHSIEWYGGGSPPARYLVPLLPVGVLAAAQVLAAPRPWRHLGVLLLPPSLFSWWALVTRPHFSINPGDGGFWLADALARRFSAEATVFFPSFLTPRAATVIVPAVIFGLLLGLWLLTRRRWSRMRRLTRCAVALWILAAAALVLAVNLRHDRVVEIEAPQVFHRGGCRVPEAGAFSRFTRANGWRLLHGDEVVVPLNLAAGAAIRLEGWLIGTAQEGAVLEMQWDDGVVHSRPLQGRVGPGRIRLPVSPGTGRHDLRITLRCRAWGGAVLDRIVVEEDVRRP